MTSKPRAVAVVRVSAQGDRPEEHFHSPDVQLDSAKGKGSTFRILLPLPPPSATTASTPTSESTGAAKVTDVTGVTEPPTAEAKRA